MTGDIEAETCSY